MNQTIIWIKEHGGVIALIALILTVMAFASNYGGALSDLSHFDARFTRHERNHTAFEDKIDQMFLRIVDHYDTLDKRTNKILTQTTVNDTRLEFLEDVK